MLTAKWQAKVVLHKLSALLTKQKDVLVHFKFLPGDFFFSFSFAMDVQLPSLLSWPGGP